MRKTAPKRTSGIRTNLIIQCICVGTKVETMERTTQTTQEHTMYKTLVLTFALALSNTANAGDAEITLKIGASSFGVALSDTNATAGWLAVDAAPEPLAGHTKADILIESLGNTTNTLTVTYDSDMLQGEPWGVANNGEYSIYGVHHIDIDAAAAGGTLEVHPAESAAAIDGPRQLTWSDVDAEYTAYLFVSAASGETSLVLPVLDLGLVGVEPDEID